MQNRTDIQNWIGEKIKDPQYRPFAVIAKSSDICNYSCSYCYVEPHSKIKVMSSNTAKIAISKISDYIGNSRKINFIWHGGEPLIAGSDFFYEIINYSKESAEDNIEHCIQTNGSLLTDEFLLFCKRHQISVSLSFDGPEQIHDINRIGRDGTGTHGKTMLALEKIKKYGLSPGCVCVLHQQNINKIDELYNFFKDYQINFRVNPVVRSGRASQNYNSLAISPEEYGDAMIKLFDLWFNDDNPVQVEPLHTIVGNIVSPYIWGCDYHGNCLESIISINPDGSVYPCGRFAGLENFCLGNILTEDLGDMFEKELYNSLTKRDTTTVKGCFKCEYKEICNTGCMITAHMANGQIYGQDYYCIGRKKLFKHIIKNLQTHLSENKYKLN